MERDDDDDNHVRLAVKAGVTLTAGTTLTATVTGSANASCASGGPDGPTIEWKVTVATPATWVVRSLNSNEADDDFTSAGLNAAATATHTGLTFNRNTSPPAVCLNYSLELSDGSNAIFGLRTYDGDWQRGFAGLRADGDPQRSTEPRGCSSVPATRTRAGL